MGGCVEGSRGKPLQHPQEMRKPQSDEIPDGCHQLKCSPCLSQQMEFGKKTKQTKNPLNKLFDARKVRLNPNVGKRRASEQGNLASKINLSRSKRKSFTWIFLLQDRQMLFITPATNPSCGSANLRDVLEIPARHIPQLGNPRV